MYIEINGKRYQVSMKWYPNNTIDHFVEINGSSYLLEEARMNLDLESEEKLMHKDLRNRLEYEIRKKIDEL